VAPSEEWGDPQTASKEGPMARLTLLLTLLALALPAAALARPTDEAALATERYYSSYGTDPAPLVTAAPAVPAASGHDGPSWLGTAGIGAGLVLLAGGLGAYTARTVRPRGVGA
jgi:hypothetical protein